MRSVLFTLTIGFSLWVCAADAQEGYFVSQFSCLANIEAITGPSQNLSKDRSVRAYATTEGIYLFSRGAVDFYPYGLNNYTRELSRPVQGGRFEKRSFLAFIPPISETPTVLKVTANVWYKTLPQAESIERIQFYNEFLGGEEYKKARGILFVLSPENAAKSAEIPKLMEEHILQKLKEVSRPVNSPTDNIKRSCLPYMPDVG